MKLFINLERYRYISRFLLILLALFFLTAASLHAKEWKGDRGVDIQNGLIEGFESESVTLV